MPVARVKDERPVKGLRAAAGQEPLEPRRARRIWSDVMYLSARLTPDEINAHNAQVFERLARDRAIHLVWIYALLIGGMIGGVVEHFWRL